MNSLRQPIRLLDNIVKLKVSAFTNKSWVAA